MLLHLKQLTPEEVPVGSILPQRILIGNGVAALLNEKLELLLIESHLVGEDELCLHALLDHVPEGLDRVELWGVARLKDERHIEILGLLLDDLCHVAPMIVDHNVQVRIFAEGARLSNLHEKVAHLDLVG